ncbi:hypothetical protein BRC93_04270 [Halobacteriales archaeon QS_5_70_15]|nr:MAG: hypothetical protein BRC93_04270 [Halobacteriales archaeon QS_5_70_15]
MPSEGETAVPSREEHRRENHIGLVRPEDAEGRVAEVYREILEDRDGDLDDDLALSTLWMALGNDPDLLEAVWAHTDHVYDGGSLSFELKSMISLVVASVMECEGCRFFHESALEREGADDEAIREMKELRIGEGRFSPTEYGVLAFAEKAARDPHGITDAEFERLRELGLSERELLEVVDCIAHHVYTAYVQAISGIVYRGMSREEWASGVADGG